MLRRLAAARPCVYYVYGYNVKIAIFFHLEIQRSNSMIQNVILDKITLGCNSVKKALFQAAF